MMSTQEGGCQDCVLFCEGDGPIQQQQLNLNKTYPHLMHGRRWDIFGQWIWRLFCYRQLEQRAMLNQKQGKMEARQLKNILISSRNQSEAIHNSARNSDLKKTATFQQRFQDSNLKVSAYKQPLTSSRRSQESGSSSANKRLKLKDYIHLNGLEKKTKSKSSLTSTQLLKTQKSITETQHPPLISTFTPTPQPQDPNPNPTFFSNKKIADNDYYLMIRQEIVGKIEQQRKKLGDLQTWIMRDFQPKQDQTETFVFLFNILNKMGDVHAINEGVGLNVKDYEKKETVEGKKLRMMKKESYHWEEEPKELDSPAKIMTSALKLTFDLASLLGISK